MLLTDLRELKKILEINPNNTQEDGKLNFLIEWASKWIEELLDRGPLEQREWTEYFNGTNTQNLCLLHRPVFTDPAPRVWVHEDGFFGQKSGAFIDDHELTYGTDFVVDTRESTTQKGESGILVRVDDVWNPGFYRSRGMLSPYIGPSNGSIKVTYTAGYTVDDLPSTYRMACNFIVMELRYVLPVGMKIGSDGYEGRSLGIINSQKDYLLGMVYPMIWGKRNWGF